MAITKADVNELNVEQLFALRDMVAMTLKEKNGFAKVEAKKSAEETKISVEKEVRAAIAAKMIVVGTNVVMKFKGEEKTFAVKGFSDKTITVETPDGARYLRFAAFVRIA